MAKTKTKSAKLFADLKKDHRKVEDLFKQIEKASEKKREQLFETLKLELMAHTKAEEEALYPELKNAEKTEDLALEAYEEHHVVDLLLEEISGFSPDDERWMAKVTVLKEIIEHHVEEEEEEFFKKADKILDKETQEEIALKVEEIKQSVKKSA